jgi:hypothetical protein
VPYVLLVCKTLHLKAGNVVCSIAMVTYVILFMSVIYKKYLLIIRIINPRI